MTSELNGSAPSEALALLGTENAQTEQLAIRQRRRPGTPPLGLPLQGKYIFDPDHILFDKLQFNLSLLVEFSGREEAHDFLEFIGDQALASCPLLEVPAHSVVGATGGKTRLKILEGWNIEGIATLMLSGSFKGRLELALSLNPTKWIRELTTCDLQHLRALSPVDALRKRQSNTDQRVIDGNTNLLPKRGRPGDPLADDKVRDFVPLTSVYLEKVEELLQELLVPSPERPLPGRIATPRLSALASAELYLEWYSPDARRDMNEIQVACAAAISGTAWTTYGNRVRSEMLENSVAVTVRPTKKVTVVAYPKAENTVRTEVRFTGEVKASARVRSDRPSTVVDQLVSLRANAAGRFQTFFRAISEYQRAPRHRASTIDLVCHLGDAAGENTSLFRQMLVALAFHGGLAGTSIAGDPINEAIRRLVAQEVLVEVAFRHGNSKGTRRYSLRPEYRDAASRIA